ncbi:GIY-YIG nuclease family protein [Oceanobacter mangrovi]|uniref:GIY-YIG nuclease family protein n=1 Tax=Oceanobacter mangrovi TaxID=2862510 RepID=UPI001C8D34BC|nr:GIY-YIG nuclease family protein [Oceanobacter mangrovi]
MAWFVYLIRNNLGQLYCGATNHVIRRFREHSGGSKKAARALRGKTPLQLEWSIQLPDKAAALRCEYRVKQLGRQQKLRLIAGDEAVRQRVVHGRTEQ